ncbi:hypothetical protein [Lactococcus kimchii]|uniref:hypothetical protein n=1 Tax=Lactococcus sp. S-13 TaxID=2507158 RepID=UPI001CC1D07B|nr:hypothetical protein [Lactococcus sp. S-13]
MKSITAENKYILLFSTPLDENRNHYFIRKSVSGNAFNKNVFFINTNREPWSIKITAGMVQRWKEKQQAKRDLRACYTRPVDDSLFLNTFELSMANKANGREARWIAPDLYWAGYARGIREQRQRSRKTDLSAFDILAAADVVELSSELGIAEDKLTYAVMEVISKRKNGGYQ